MPDSGDIDAALSQRLLSDPALAALMPDGVYYDVAKHGAQRFVILSLISGEDVPMFRARAYEDGLYLVKAVALSTTGADVKAAAARIDVLLDGQDLTIAGYAVMRLARVDRVRYVEVDEDTDARWQHRGGHYALTVSSA